MSLNKKKKITIVSVVLLMIIFMYNLYRSYYMVVNNYYQLCDAKIEKEIKLVVISDMHDHVFGEKNSILIENIAMQNPDIILMVGDMLNQDSDNLDYVIGLIEELNSTAPIYYALGNHELQWEKMHNIDLRKLLRESGAIVLDKSYSDIVLNNQCIRIGGLYEYAFYFGNLDDPLNKKKYIYNYLLEYQDTDAYKIMLSHKPDSFIFADASERWDIDLVMSGHLHGGQVVIPFFGGLYAGDQGFFPEYIHGMYKKDNMNILITSGLSTNKKILPRWNNPPEIIVLELLPE